MDAPRSKFYPQGTPPLAERRRARAEAGSGASPGTGASAGAAGISTQDTRLWSQESAFAYDPCAEAFTVGKSSLGREAYTSMIDLSNGECG